MIIRFTTNLELTLEKFLSNGKSFKTTKAVAKGEFMEIVGGNKDMFDPDLFHLTCLDGAIFSIVRGNFYRYD